MFKVVLQYGRSQLTENPNSIKEYIIVVLGMLCIQLVETHPVRGTTQVGCSVEGVIIYE